MKISTEQKQKVNKTAKKYGLKLVLLFGSFASGKTREDSDLDIAVLGRKRIDFKRQIDLINDLSDIFKKNIDLSVLNNANPLLLFESTKNPALLFGKADNLANLRIYAFHRYNDYKPYFEMENKLNKRLIKQYAV